MEKINQNMYSVYHSMSCNFSSKEISLPPPRSCDAVIVIYAKRLSLFPRQFHNRAWLWIEALFPRRKDTGKLKKGHRTQWKMWFRQWCKVNSAWSKEEVGLWMLSGEERIEWAFSSPDWVKYSDGCSPPLGFVQETIQKSTIEMFSHSYHLGYISF